MAGVLPEGLFRENTPGQFTNMAIPRKKGGTDPLMGIEERMI
jgi:hypothetical protein